MWTHHVVGSCLFWPHEQWIIIKDYQFLLIPDVWINSHSVSYFLFSPIHVFNFLVFLHLTIECSLWGISSCCLSGGGTGWLAEHLCVCMCVFGGLLAAEPCWDCPSAAAAKHSAAFPSFPSAPLLLPQTSAPTDWLNSCPGYIDVCVCVCMFEYECVF